MASTTDSQHLLALGNASHHSRKAKGGKKRKHRQMVKQQDNTAGKIASRSDGAHSVSRNGSRVPARGQTKGATGSKGLEGAARRLQLST